MSTSSKHTSFFRLLGRLFTVSLGLFVILLLAAFSLSDKLTYDVAEARLHQLQGRMARHLQQNGVLFALSFDERLPHEAITRAPLVCHGTESIPSPTGHARQFIPNTKGQISFQPSLFRLPSTGYSILLRYRDDGTHPGRQTFLLSREGNNALALTLEDGIIHFVVPSASSNASVVLHSKPVPINRFFSVFAVVDDANAHAQLFIDGVLADEAAFDPGTPPHTRIGFYSENWHPIRGAIDELVLWSRPLSIQEIKRFSRSHKSIQRQSSPLLSWLASVLEATARTPAEAHRSLERLYPKYLFASRSTKSEIPSLDLSMSKGDLRHFTNTHTDSVRNGERTRKAADFRNCRIQSSNGVIPTRVCLDNIYTNRRLGDSHRRAYILSGDLDGCGSNRIVRLYPPEAYAHIHPESAVPLCMDESAYVRLSINGDRQGIYCLEPIERLGGASVADAIVKFSILRSTSTPSNDAFFRLSPSERIAQTERILKHILVEPRSEWSGREWRWKLRHVLNAPQEPNRFSAFDALGSNKAPFLLTTDLDLSNNAFQNVSSWIASNPSVLSAEGHVQRPSGSLPQRADLTPVFADGSQGTPLRFRVMPETHTLPILSLFISQVVLRESRVDFSALYDPAGDAPPRQLTGFGDTGGGVSHRGNSSYMGGEKRSFSLEFDDPHHILGPDSACHINLISGYGDDTRLRNRLSYDLFRALSRPEAPRYAPEIDWIEIFVNGEYYGVFEMSSRVNKEMFPDENPPELFKARLRSDLFNEPSAHALSQAFPSYPEIDCEESLHHLMAIAMNPSPEEFIAQCDAELDLPCFIDHMLLVSFTGNTDGVVNNLFIARNTTTDRKYFVIPWDYDKTFIPGSRTSWLSHRLDDKLARLHPTYKDDRQNRWNALRQTLFSDDALTSRLDFYHRQLAPYMPFELELLNRDPQTFDTQYRTLRAEVLRRAALLDRVFATHPTPQPTP